MFVVDDHQIFLDGIVSLLDDEPNIKIAGTAHNGKQAVERIKNSKVDVVLMDINMPDMDGITLLEQVRSNQRLAGLPIVMLTASVLDDDRLRALKAGASGFLTKPVSSWELLDIVNRQLQTKT